MHNLYQTEVWWPECV